VYELGHNVLASWPDECEGAYICCLSNPQNLDISKLLGSDATQSPFYRVLAERPKAMMMLANKNTPIHSRLWCVLEAYQAQACGVQQIRIEGAATDIVTGERGAALKKAESEAAELERKAKEEARAANERLLEQDDPAAKKAADEAANEAKKQIAEAKDKAASTRLDVLLAPAKELIDLENAQCSMEADRVAIRAMIGGSEDKITEQIGELIRNNIAGVGEKRDDPNVVDGPLGPLKVDAPSLTIGDGKLGTPAAVLQLAKWLWSRPAAKELVLKGAQLLPIGGDVLCAAARLGLLDGMRLKCAYRSLCACFLRSPPPPPHPLFRL